MPFNIEDLEEQLVENINKDIPSTNLFNYDLTPKQRDKSEYCLGRQGLSRVKLDNFYLSHTHMLAHSPKQAHKMYPSVYFIDFFNIGKYCIINGLTQNKFCSDAIREKMKRDIPNDDLVKIGDINE